MEPYLPHNENTDHINIYSKSRTLLGRCLSNFADIGFKCSDGYFASVEGYWYWLSTGCRHTELRNAHGFGAKLMGKELLSGSKEEKAPNFQSKIKLALWCKVLQNTHLYEELAQSSLPLAHYYWFGKDINKPDKVVYLPQYQWIVDEISLIRDKLQYKVS